MLGKKQRSSGFEHAPHFLQGLDESTTLIEVCPSRGAILAL